MGMHVFFEVSLLGECTLAMRKSTFVRFLFNMNHDVREPVVRFSEGSNTIFILALDNKTFSIRNGVFICTHSEIRIRSQSRSYIFVPNVIFKLF